MAQRPFQFLHAADLHLDDPVEGLGEAPARLADLVIDCPLNAARRLFEAAVQHRVDFVVLSGDVVDLRRRWPREMAFLVEQFQFLAKHDITVYWAGGEIDSFDWPSAYSLPSNVKLASRFHLQRLKHEIGGAPVCELAGRSRNSSDFSEAYDFGSGKAELFSIAVAHGQQLTTPADIGARYWALGGSHRRSTQQISPHCIAHYPGTSQGRRPSEAGAHGCTLVQVDELGQARLTPLTTDAVRWESPQLSVSVAADRSQLELLLRDHIQRHFSEPGGPLTLVEWRINCQGSLFAELRRGKLASELLAALQRDFGERSSAPVWSVAINAELDSALPAVWQQEESLRGDFVRAVQGLIADELVEPATRARRPQLHDLLARGSSLAGDAKIDRSYFTIENATARCRLLRQAAWLGADLLSPEEVSR